MVIVKNGKKVLNSFEERLEELLEVTIFMETVLNNFLEVYTLLYEEVLFNTDFSTERLLKLHRNKKYIVHKVIKTKKMLNQNLKIIEEIANNKL